MTAEESKKGRRLTGYAEGHLHLYDLSKADRPGKGSAAATPSSLWGQ